MKAKLFYSTAIMLFLSFSMIGQGQMKPTFEVKFLNSKVYKNNFYSPKDVVIIFLVSTKDAADFPPVPVLPPRVNIIENGVEKPLDLSPNNLSIEFDGADVPQKNNFIYELIKEQVDLKSMNTAMIMCFYVKNINAVSVKKMNCTLRMSEKRNRDITQTLSYEFEAEQ